MTPVERMLETLPDAKQSGKGWSARCPAHEDRRASLSIAQGDDGRALVKCHAGCKADAICAAVGLTVLDLVSYPRWTSPGPWGESREDVYAFTSSSIYYYRSYGQFGEIQTLFNPFFGS